MDCSIGTGGNDGCDDRSISAPYGGGHVGETRNEQLDRHQGVEHPEKFSWFCIPGIPNILLWIKFIEPGCSVPSVHGLMSFYPLVDEDYPESAS